MNMRILPVAAIALRLATIAAAGFFFVRGQTRLAPDGGTAVLLAPDKRDLVLAEMRGLLGSVLGMIDGVKAENVKHVARASGMAAAADVKPALMAKLPLEFRHTSYRIETETPVAK